MSVVKAIILGFIALFVGAQLVPQLWDNIMGPNQSKVVGPYGNGTVNGTTKTFMEMVPWMTAIGLVITAVTVFIVSAKKRL